MLRVDTERRFLPRFKNRGLRRELSRTLGAVERIKIEDLCSYLQLLEVLNIG